MKQLGPIVDRLDTNTLLALFGLLILAAGVAMLSVPAAFIVVGILVIVYVVLPDQKAPVE